MKSNGFLALLSYKSLGLLLLALGLIAAANASVSLSTEGDNPFLPGQWAPGANLVVSATTVDEPSGAYQWFHGDQPLVSPTSSTLTLSAVTAADAGNYFVRFTPSGHSAIRSNTVVVNVLTPPTSPVDLAFSSSLPAELGLPSPVVTSTSGSLLVRLNSSNGVSRYVRLRTDGTVDFTYPASVGDLTLLALLPGNSVLSRNSPYLLGADGSTSTLTLPAGFTPGTALDAAAVEADGKILIAQGAHLARLNSDLSVDSSFAYSSTAITSFRVFRFDTSGRIYAHGTQSATTDSPATPIAIRLSSTGMVDATFAAQAPLLAWAGIDIFPLSDGRILRFETRSGPMIYFELLADNGQTDPIFQSGQLVILPYEYAVDAQRARFYYVDSSHRAVARKITADSFQPDGSFYGGTGLTTGLTLAPDGSLLAAGEFSSWDGHATSRLARLRTTDVVQTAPSVDVTKTAPHTPAYRGDPVTLTAVHQNGDTPTSYQWLALDGQTLPAVTTASVLNIGSFASANLGRYQLRVANAAGSTLSPVIDLSGNEALPYLANLSGRAFSGDGENTLIAGLTVSSDFNALIRGVGPTLKSLGLSGALADPTLQLFTTSGQLIAANDDAPATLAATAATLGAYPLEVGGHDAAAYVALSSGEYTVLLNKKTTDSHGVALAEIYAALTVGQQSSFPLSNLSLRARTDSDDATAIAGFVVIDPLGFDRSSKFLLRAVGPSLADHGITAPLANPVLTVYNSAGQVIAQNDDWPWHLTAEYTAFDDATDQVGAFHLRDDSKDAALLLDLPAGAYTLHATGGSGVVLLEIYLVR